MASFLAVGNRQKFATGDKSNDIYGNDYWFMGQCRCVQEDNSKNEIAFKNG